MTFIMYFVQLLAIMNPFSVIPVFLTLTQDLCSSDVKSILRKATIASLTIVIAFTLLGRYILEVFNISIASLRVGGGVILMVLAVDMLGEEVRTKKIYSGDIAVVPIATPLIIGPGTITTILLLTSSQPGNLINLILVLVSGVLACITSFWILAFSNVLVKYLKTSTVRALGRFMALIIAGVAVEMIVKGVKMYYDEMFKG
jgi:multiple antibiotic resistance protein